MKDCIVSPSSLRCVFMAASLQAQDRTVLPPTTPEFKGKIGETYKDSTPDFSPRCR